jgi:putative endonuclease
LRSGVARIWFVYLLECVNGRLYTGITTDLAARFRSHSSGKGASFMRINKPARMLAATPCANRSEASKLEWAIKSLKPAEKRRAAQAWALQDDLPGQPRL